MTVEKISTLSLFLFIITSFSLSLSLVFFLSSYVLCVSFVLCLCVCVFCSFIHSCVGWSVTLGMRSSLISHAIAYLPMREPPERALPDCPAPLSSFTSPVHPRDFLPVRPYIICTLCMVCVCVCDILFSSLRLSLGSILSLIPISRLLLPARIYQMMVDRYCVDPRVVLTCLAITTLGCLYVCARTRAKCLSPIIICISHMVQASSSFFPYSPVLIGFLVDSSLFNSQLSIMCLWVVFVRQMTLANIGILLYLEFQVVLVTSHHAQC